MELLKKLDYFSPHSVLASLNFLSLSGTVKEDFITFILEGIHKEPNFRAVETIIDYSTGDSAIALALKARQLQKRCIIVLPSNVSLSVIKMLLKLRVEIIICDARAAPESNRSYIKIAERVSQHIPNSYFINHYYNSSNSLAHYYMTAGRLADYALQLDLVVCPVESGGLITGCGKLLKEKNPEIKIVGVESEGSVLGTLGSINPESLSAPEIGQKLVPSVLDYSLVDQWITLKKSDIALSHQEMISTLGILGGTASASAFLGMKKMLQWQKVKKRGLVIFTDSYREQTRPAFLESSSTKYPFVFTTKGKISLSRYFK